MGDIGNGRHRGSNSGDSGNGESGGLSQDGRSQEIQSQGSRQPQEDQPQQNLPDHERFSVSVPALGDGPSGEGRPGPDRLTDAEAELLLNAFGTGYTAPGPAAIPSVGNSAVAGSRSRMSYSAGRDSAGDATNSASDPAGIDSPATPAGPWRPDGHAGSGDSGGGTTVSSVDFLADLGPSADAQAVARLLSAAAAPPWPHELRGYDAARRAFESAGSPGKAASGATPIRHSAGLPFRRLLGVKLVAVAGALTVTGVAVAAEADVLPSPIQRAAHQMLGGVGVPEPDPNTVSAQSSASGSLSSSSQHSASSASGPGGLASGPSASGSGLVPGTPAGTADPTGQPTSADADPVALCQAYVAHGGNQNNNGNGNGDGGLNDHDHKLLVALAGGADKIDAYCAQVLGAGSTAPVPQPSGTSGLPTTPSVTPDPSHDHKPGTSSSSEPSFDPQTTGQSTTANGHTHTPSPTHPGH